APASTGASSRAVLGAALELAGRGGAGRSHPRGGAPGPRLDRPAPAHLAGCAVGRHLLGNFQPRLHRLQAVFPARPSEGMAVILALPLPVLIAIILTTSITEVILFRGYPIERLRVPTGHLWIGVAISMVLNRLTLRPDLPHQAG